MPDVYSFTLSRPCIGLSNRDHNNQPAFGQVEVELGPMRFSAYVAADGDVSLPRSLADRELRKKIAAEARAAILTETCARWVAVTVAEERR